MPVAQSHPRHELAEARLLLRAVGAHVAVPLVDHVVVLRVEPARHLRVAAELVHHGVVVEAPVHVAGRALVAPDVAALAVEHGLLALLAAAHEVPGRAGEGLRLGLVERRLPLPPGQVHVPGVEVRLHVPSAAAGGVVLDEARRVELLREVEALPDPLLRLGEPGGLPVRALRLQAPLLVEEHPREDGRVVEVAAHHAAQGRLPLLAHRLVGLAPAVRHVGHDQDAQPVGPVELARHLDLDVGANRVEPQPPRDQDLLAHRLVGGPGPVAVRVPGLVEGHLEVDRLAVERHVRVAEPGRPLDTDLPEAEVRLHAVLGPARRERQGRVVQEGVLERPQARAFPEGQGQAGLAAPDGHERLRLRLREGGVARAAVGDLQLHDRPLGRGGGEPHARLHPLQGRVRVELERLHVDGRAGLEVDGLPQPARLAVALLALELEGVRRVVHPQDEPLLPPGLRGLRELQVEGRVAPLVRADRLAVEPPARPPVGGPDHEEDPLALPALRHPHRARVPRDVGLVADPGQLRSPGERHADREREAGGRALEPALAPRPPVLVEPEGPVAVQVHPLRPLEVRPRVLGKRDGRRGVRGRRGRRREQEEAQGREEEESRRVSHG